jgi:hypothetical protein
VEGQKHSLLQLLKCCWQYEEQGQTLYHKQHNAFSCAAAAAAAAAAGAVQDLCHTHSGATAVTQQHSAACTATTTC